MSQTFIPLSNPIKNNSLSHLLNTNVIFASIMPSILEAKETEAATQLPRFSIIDSRSNESYNAP